MTAFGTRGNVKYQRARTTECPTCGASKGRPCERIDKPGSADAALERGWTVSPHAARKRLESLEKETP